MSTFLMLTHYAALIVTVGACLYLFLTAKRDLRVVETRSMRRGEKLRVQLTELAQELELVRRELETRDQRSDPAGAVARTLGPGVRIQALRMIKHGEGPEHISAALALPRNEVDLLMKVQSLLAEQISAPAATS